MNMVSDQNLSCSNILKMKSKALVLILLLINSLISCKNYYNESIEWADKIKMGTDLETVKKSQPDFLKISWEQPLINDNAKLYEIVEIDGNDDILNMQNFLVFVDGKYQGREAKK